MKNYVDHNAKIAGAITLGVGAYLIQRSAFRKGYKQGAVVGYTTAYSEVKELVESIVKNQK